MPTGKIENNVLILTVPTFTGDSDEGKRYAEIITENLYKATYKGIILDFRDNNGGDMGPMVTGLAPILSDGNLIGFIDKNNHDTKVSLKNGMVKNGGSSVSINNQKKIAKVPIAILINGQTGSSAEITVLCFAGKHDIQLFGQPSAGYTSANSQVNLYDGRVMQITSAKIKDARGRVYDNQKIMPNVETNEPLDAALNWLNNN
nr:MULTISPECIES: S41 family peptidase [unclassified Enterococcus]